MLLQINRFFKISNRNNSSHNKNNNKYYNSNLKININNKISWHRVWQVKILLKKKMTFIFLLLIIMKRILIILIIILNYCILRLNRVLNKTWFYNLLLALKKGNLQNQEIFKKVWVILSILIIFTANNSPLAC